MLNNLLGTQNTFIDFVSFHLFKIKRKRSLIRMLCSMKKKENIGEKSDVRKDTFYVLDLTKSYRALTLSFKRGPFTM